MYSAAPQQQQQQQQYPSANAPSPQQDFARHNNSSSTMSNFYPAVASSEKQPSGYNNVRYPSLAAAEQQQQQLSSAPSFDGSGVPHAQAVPVYYNRDSAQQYQAHEQYGYPTHPSASTYQPAPHLPPPPWQYVSPVRSGDYRHHGCIGTTLKLMIFHLLNAVLGIAGFVLVITGANIAIGLIPLCCVGIIVFRGVLYLVGKLAKLDVKLYNYISPASEHVYVDIPHEARFFGHLTGERLSPQLSSFSPLAVTAALYFCTIKFAVGILSCIVVSLAGGLLTTLVMALAGTDIAGESPAFSFGDHQVSVRENAGEFVVVWVCTFVISIALMHIVARVSRASTRFFCCEKFSTYRYIHVAQHAQAPMNVSYGTY